MQCVVVEFFFTLCFDLCTFLVFDRYFRLVLVSGPLSEFSLLVVSLCVNNNCQQTYHCVNACFEVSKDSGKDPRIKSNV